MTILEVINLIISVTSLLTIGFLFYNQKKQIENSQIKLLNDNDVKQIENTIITENVFIKKKPVESIVVENFDSKLATQKLIEATPELITLFEKLGYSAKVDREATELLIELKSLIRTEIIDFEAFNKALNEISNQLVDEQISNKYRLEDNKLLNEILTVKEDLTKMLEILNRNPIYDLLPFVEQIPFYKNGELVWRPPVEHSLIRKRPSNTDLFARLLEKLKLLFSTIKNPQSKVLREDVLEAIEKLSRDLQKPTAYMPTPIKTLEEKIAAYIASAPSEAVQAKKEILSNLLAEQLILRHKYRFEANIEKILPIAESKTYRELAQQHIKKYLDTSFLQIPWLSNYLLLTLLNSELAFLASKETEENSNILQIIYQEINNDYFDGGETIRRLRQLEDKGLYLSSLIYPLLRLIMVAKRVNI